MKEIVRCKNCRFWDNAAHRNAPTEEEGFCHVWPPPAFPQPNYIAVFPKTLYDSFCGQGEPKEETNELQLLVENKE